MQRSNTPEPAITDYGVDYFVIKEYLDEYNAQPLSVKQEYAKKILKAANIYADKLDKQEILQIAGQLLGLENVTEEQAQRLKGVLQALMKLPKPRLDELLSSE